MGQGEPQDRGHVFPQINPRTMAIPLLHPLEKEPHVQRPGPAPPKAVFIVARAGHGGDDVGRMQRGLMGILSRSWMLLCLSRPPFSLPPFNFLFPPARPHPPSAHRLPSFLSLDWLPHHHHQPCTFSSLQLHSLSAHLDLLICPPPQPGFVPFSSPPTECQSLAA